MQRPVIGTKMYIVVEHYYYLKENPAPVMEYCVCQVKVSGFIKGGYTEMKVVGLSADGYITPWFYRLSDIGKRIFHTPREAALFAQKKTEKYEQRWKKFIISPMRRQW